MRAVVRGSVADDEAPDQPVPAVDRDVVLVAEGRYSKIDAGAGACQEFCVRVY
jgi:hypothetical protein